MSRYEILSSLLRKVQGFQALDARFTTAIAITTLIYSASIARGHDAENGPSVFAHVTDVEGVISWRASPFSADGTRFVTVAPGPKTSDVWVWDAKTCKSAARRIRQDGVVIVYQLSSDGKMLFTGATNKHISIWDVQTSTLTAVKNLDHELLFARFSPDGKRFVTNADDVGKLQLWLTAETKPYATLSHSEPVTFATFDNSGTRIVTREWAAGASVHLWDAKTGMESCKPIESDFNAEADTAQTAAFDLRGDRVVLARQRGFAMADVANGRILSTGHIEGDFETASLCFSADGSTVAVLTRSAIDHQCGSVQVFDSVTGRLTRSVTSGAGAFEISPNGKWLFCSSPQSPSTNLWDISNGSRLQTFEGLIGAIAISPDGRIIAFNKEDRTSIWRVRQGAGRIGS